MKVEQYYGKSNTSVACYHSLKVTFIKYNIKKKKDIVLNIYQQF